MRALHPLSTFMHLNKVTLFREVSLLKDLSDKGLFVLLPGPQVIESYNGFKAKYFIGYVNGTTSMVENAISDSTAGLYSIAVQDAVISIRENHPSEYYIFSFITANESINNDEFVEKILNNDKTTLYNSIGYEYSSGIFDAVGRWGKMKSGEYLLPDDFAKNVISEPDILSKVIGEVIEYDSLHFSEEAVFTIRQLSQSVSLELTSTLIELVGEVIENKPYKLELLHNLGVLKNALPEFDVMFDVKETLPDFNFSSFGEAAIMILGGLTPIQAWTVLAYCAGKASSPVVEENGISFIPSFVDEAIYIAETYMPLFDYSEMDVKYVTKYLYTLSADLPTTEDDIKRFIIDYFTDEEDLDDFMLIKNAVIHIYNGNYKESQLKLLNAVYDKKDSYLKELSIDDDDIEQLVGEDNFIEAKDYIRDIIYSYPELDEPSAISDLLIKNGNFDINWSAKVIKITDCIENGTAFVSDIDSLSMDELSAYQVELSDAIENFSEMLVDNIKRTSNPTYEEFNYVKAYEKYLNELHKVNAKLLENSNLNSEEKAHIELQENQYKEYNEKKKQENLAKTAFTDNDTEFFQMLCEHVTTSN